MANTFYIFTLGCKVNQYESEAIHEKMISCGFLPSSCDIADVYIINTCTVTGESDRKCGQMIRKAVKLNPDAAILVTGCFAQVSPEKIASIYGVDYVCGSVNKLSVAEEALNIVKHGKYASPKVAVGSLDNAPFDCMEINDFKRTRAYIKIEDGCNNKCSYCIIPTARGRVRSKKPCEIIAEINKLYENGCREVVLTGIETDAYGLDLDGYRLQELTADICEKTKMPRIRFGSLDPSLFTEDFVENVCKNPRVLPHYHISLQSGSSSTLAAMRRRYNADMAHRALERIRGARPDTMFSADVIVGFPGESDESFNETLEFIRNERFITLHVFQYSKRAGTEAAARKDQVDPAVKKMRSEMLINEQKKIRKQILSSFSQKPLPLLLERTEIDADGRMTAQGHTDCFIQMKAELRSEHKRSDVITVTVTDHDGDTLYGYETN